MLFVGIDLGTSSVKLLLVDEKGQIHGEVTKEYPVYFPKEGWSEQHPEDWISAVKSGLTVLLNKVDKSQVAGIGCGGQMHGLVALDENDNVIRPAILWNDGRTFAETEYLNHLIGQKVLSEETANIAFAGFTAPKILWMKNKEPENFDRIAKIMLPKDYVVYCLTGVHATDYSDASGMLLLDVEHKCWSKKMLEICSITEEQLPKLYESYEVVGTVKPEIAECLGIGEVKVVAGAGDNAAAAVGTGTVGEGKCNISLGTSGTIFVSSEEFGSVPENALHAFCHADGKYHLMGCMLSAASCNNWWMKDILGTTDFAGMQKEIDTEKLGQNHVYFLPYLMGERSPINDTNARGTFVGMTMDTSRADLLQAIFEGVAFAIRDSYEVAKQIGIEITASNICGGGAKSQLWKTILAAVLNLRLDCLQTEQGPGFGGAMLAMVGCGVYDTVSTACEALVKVSESVEPDAELAALYEKRYNNYKKIYPALKTFFADAIKED